VVTNLKRGSCDHSSRELTASDCENRIQLVQPVSSQFKQTSNVIEHKSMNCLFKRFSSIFYVNIFILPVEPELLAVLQEYESSYCPSRHIPDKLRTAPTSATEAAAK
jgi:hypothetical protein